MGSLALVSASNWAIGQGWDFVADSFAPGTQPSATAGNGTSVTCAQNAFSGGYTNILSNLAQDCFLLEVMFGAGFVAGQARDTLVNLSLDGGSSVFIRELLASCAGGTVRGDVRYVFPIYLPAGKTISAAASVNNATPGTIKCRLRAFGAPRDPRRIRFGTYVKTIGTVAATSKGTDITAGQAAEGAYQTLGTTDAALWWWQVGMGVNNVAMNNFFTHVDLALNVDGANDLVVIPDQLFCTSSNEELWNYPQSNGCEFEARVGATVKGRAQSSGAIANVSLAAYAVGG